MKKIIAGTVMLTMEDGSKKFLVNLKQDALHLVSSEAQPEMTGLASILNVLKETVQLDVTKLRLLELTNGMIVNQSVPIFIFEMDQKDTTSQLPETYIWEQFSEFQKIVQKFEIEGMPHF